MISSGLASDLELGLGFIVLSIVPEVCGAVSLVGLTMRETIRAMIPSTRKMFKIFFIVPQGGFEPPTYCLEGSCSIQTELLEQVGCLSGRRGSNPRPSPWQGDALPL